jgi:hypothetical protein
MITDRSQDPEGTVAGEIRRAQLPGNAESVLSPGELLAEGYYLSTLRERLEIADDLVLLRARDEEEDSGSEGECMLRRTVDAYDLVSIQCEHSVFYRPISLAP